MSVCNFCSKILSSNQRLRSHIAVYHTPTAMDSIDDIPDDENSTIGDDRSVDIMEDDEESMSEEGDEEEEDSKNWDVLMDIMTSDLDDDELDALIDTGEAGKKLFERLRKFVPSFLELAKNIESSDIYERIAEEVDRLVDNDEDYDDAVHMTWKNRKIQILRQVIDPYIEKIMNDGDSVTDDDDDNY